MSGFDTFSVYRQPDWMPLERVLTVVFGADAADAIGAFWFIGFVKGPAGAGDLRLYEHSQTRREIAVDGCGCAYRRQENGPGFVPVDLEDALVGVFL